MVWCARQRVCFCVCTCMGVCISFGSYKSVIAVAIALAQKGDIMRTDSFSSVITAWLNASQRHRLGISMNRSTGRPNREHTSPSEDALNTCDSFIRLVLDQLIH